MRKWKLLFRYIRPDYTWKVLFAIEVWADNVEDAYDAGSVICNSELHFQLQCLAEEIIP